jgi:hypothetical protein
LQLVICIEQRDIVVGDLAWADLDDQAVEGNAPVLR